MQASPSRCQRDMAGLSGTLPLALLAGRTAFERSLSLKGIQAAAMAGLEWDTLRLQIRTSLADAKYTHDRTEIYLGEGMIDEAVRSVDLTFLPGGPSDAVLIRIEIAARL